MANRRKYKINPFDLARNKAIGVLLPFGTDKSFLKLSYTTEEQAVSNLKNLLLTMKGERPFQPDFGTEIYTLLFSQITADTEQRLQDSIESDINFWLPYIIIDSININSEENTVNVTLTFRVTGTGANQTVSIVVTESGGLTVQ